MEQNISNMIRVKQRNSRIQMQMKKKSNYRINIQHFCILQIQINYLQYKYIKFMFHNQEIPYIYVQDYLQGMFNFENYSYKNKSHLQNNLNNQSTNDKSQAYQGRKSQPLFKLEKRECLMIQTTCQTNYEKIKNGHPTETKHLTQYTAVHTGQFLKTIIKDKKQIPKIRGNNSNNFDTFRSLFGFQNEHQNAECENIRKECQKYYRKVDYLKQIIKYKRQMTQTIIIVKYLNKIHTIPIHPQSFNNWKHNA